MEGSEHCRVQGSSSLYPFPLAELPYIKQRKVELLQMKSDGDTGIVGSSSSTDKLGCGMNNLISRP